MLIIIFHSWKTGLLGWLINIKDLSSIPWFPLSIATSNSAKRRPLSIVFFVFTLSLPPLPILLCSLSHKSPNSLTHLWWAMSVRFGRSGDQCIGIVSTPARNTNSYTIDEPSLPFNNVSDSFCFFHLAFDCRLFELRTLLCRDPLLKFELILRGPNERQELYSVIQAKPSLPILESTDISPRPVRRISLGSQYSPHAKRMRWAREGEVEVGSCL